MLIQNKNIQEKLKAIASTLSGNRTDPEDLMQEMMIHLWQTETKKPGMTDSWYLQSCKFHARDCVRKGKSVDVKTRPDITIVPWENRDEQSGNSFEPVDPHDFRSQLMVNDLADYVTRKLDGDMKIVFQGIQNEMNLSDISRSMSVCHQKISYSKKKIAQIVRKELKHVA